MNTITLKGIIDEDFVNYKVPAMTLIFPYCNFKCEKEQHQSFCHNSSLVQQKNIESLISNICNRYIKNPITSAVVCQGLEPFDSFKELFDFISTLRFDYKCENDIVIYTGYNKNEIEDKIELLKNFKNIIIKFGRFIPNQQKHFDNILKIYLASDNQYAEKIS